jgi:tripartite ATP-independent transporter DctM subunit
MSIELITVVMFGGLILFLLAGAPIAFVCGSMAVIITMLVLGPDAFYLVVSRVWSEMTEFSLAAIPLFIFMANVLERSGVGERLFGAIHVWTGWIPGSLAVSTILATTILAAMVGIVGAGEVLMGLIALPAMLNRGYSKSLALGCILAGGGLGQLIPPAVMLIVYGLVANVSIGKLFAGGLGAGLLLASLYVGYIMIRSLIQPELAPKAPPEERYIPLRDKLVALKGIVIPLGLVLLVLGSIFTGAATPTEAAGVGAVGALISAAIHRQLTWQNVQDAVFRSTRSTCMILWIFFAVSAFSSVFTLAGGGQLVENTILNLPLGPWGILIAIQAFYILMGVPMDWLGILLITGPVVIPIVKDLGFDLVWFGILFDVNMQIAYLSPPVGAAMFYLKSVAPKEITMGDIFKAALPFCGLQLLGLILIMIFPQIVLWPAEVLVN